MQALMACPCLELSAPKADALLPWVLQVWSPRGRSVPMVNWGSHVFPPGFPSQATTASTQPVRKVLFRYVLTQQSVVLAAWLELP